MSSQTEMVKIIKEWITIDNDIRNINKELRVRKDKLKKISQNLMKTMKENEIDELGELERSLAFEDEVDNSGVTGQRNSGRFEFVE